MINSDYLNMALSLFDSKKQQAVLRLCKQSNNTLDTIILSYVFYIYNSFPYCISNTVHGDVITKKVPKPIEVDNVVDRADIIVSTECCHFLDKMISFIATKAYQFNKKNDHLCHYIAYLFLTDTSLLAYKLFQEGMSKRDYNYAISVLEKNLFSIFNLPDDENLLKYGKFLTNPLSADLESCSGREKELSELIDILSRKKKNNVLLVGQPGVGKTALVQGLARILMSKDCPERFEGYHIYEASMSSMLAGAKYRGDFEERFESVLNAVVGISSNIILFIDEIHTIVANQGEPRSVSSGMSAADMLKPIMSKPGLLLVGATTEQEYHMIEKDSALNRRFSILHIKEPNSETLQQLLQDKLFEYQNHFNIQIKEYLLSEIIKYSENYISNKFMPDKALDLLDESCVYCTNHRHSSELDLQDIVSATEILTGMTIPTIGEQASSKIYKIINHLKDTIVGQDEAIDSISSIVKKYFLGFITPEKPIGSFLFVGPTGVGKTQLCKELAYSMFTKESFIRLDMSEYMEAHSVSKLIGSPPGYVGYGSGGLLTNAIKNNPYSVILFDEIEKAHPDVFNILLQVLDDGRITDSEGFSVSFCSCIIILTSNIGAQEVREKSSNIIGFGNTGLSNNDRTKIYEDCVKKKFRPEFINRLNKIVCFNTLSESDIKKLVDRELSNICDKFNKNNIQLEVEVSVRQYLYNKCYSMDYGARYVKRIIATDIENIIVDYLLEHNLISKTEPIKISIIRQDDVITCKVHELAVL